MAEASASGEYTLITFALTVNVLVNIMFNIIYMVYESHPGYIISRRDKHCLQELTIILSGICRFLSHQEKII